jgi:hypothetical protein
VLLCKWKTHQPSEREKKTEQTLEEGEEVLVDYQLDNEEISW